MPLQPQMPMQSSMGFGIKPKPTSSPMMPQPDIPSQPMQSAMGAAGNAMMGNKLNQMQGAMGAANADYQRIPRPQRLRAIDAAVNRLG